MLIHIVMSSNGKSASITHPPTLPPLFTDVLNMLGEFLCTLVPALLIHKEKIIYDVEMFTPKY